MTLNSQKRGFGKFFTILAAAHISTVNCDEMAGDRPTLPANEIFSFNVDFNSPSPDPLGSRSLVHAGIKDGYPLKKWLF